MLLVLSNLPRPCGLVKKPGTELVPKSFLPVAATETSVINVRPMGFRAPISTHRRNFLVTCSSRLISRIRGISEQKTVQKPPIGSCFLAPDGGLNLTTSFNFRRLHRHIDSSCDLP
jgi:hypothetical protein